VIFLVRWLTPLQPLGLDAWRWALILGAIGSLITGILFRLLPESPRWLDAVGRHAEADASCRRIERAAGLAPSSEAPASAPPAREREKPDDGFWSAARGRQHRLRALLLGAMYFLTPWATIGFPLLSGAVLVEKGFRVSDSLLYVGITMFGPSIGVLVGAFVIDRFERRTALAVCATAMALLGLAFAVSATPTPLMIVGIALNLIQSIYIAALSVYGAELFPTALRARASAGAWAVNRLTSALVPLVLLPLLVGSGAIAMFSAVAAALIASVVLVLAFGPRGLARRPVE
jgi:MFS transporter, putative metabolite:H+ symporter